MANYVSNYFVVSGRVPSASLGPHGPNEEFWGMFRGPEGQKAVRAKGYFVGLVPPDAGFELLSVGTQPSAPLAVAYSESRWDPPTEMLRQLSTDSPERTFTLFWAEPTEPSAGLTQFRAGRQIAACRYNHSSPDYRLLVAAFQVSGYPVENAPRFETSDREVVIDVREDRTHEARPYTWAVVCDARTRDEIETFIETGEADALRKAEQYCEVRGLTVVENFEDSSEEESEQCKP